MRIYKLFIVVLSVLLLSNVYAATIVSNEYYLPYGENQKIYLKEKKLSSTKSYKFIVLLNSLSIPALNAFDIPGYSLMDSLAKKGYDVWGIDFIGEGKSTYPIQMTESPTSIGVYPLSATDAVKQLNSSINFILKKSNKKSVAILGWSWGSVVGAIYSIQNPQQINHLILYGSMYSSLLAESAQQIFVKPYESTIGVFRQNLPAYQNIPWKIINVHWNMMLNNNPNIVTESTIKQVGEIYCQIDPKPFIKGSLRRPMGPMKDLFAIWNGKPIYDINKLTTPTLVIYGNQDIFADRALYSKLINVKTKEQIELKDATHWLIYEKTRLQFIDAIVNFLNK